MDPTQQTHQKPIEPSLHWHDRLLHWSGWEQMVEYRRQLIGITVCLVVVIGLIGWWIARRESSSVTDVIRAEIVVQRLRNAGASPEAPTIPVQTDLKRLEELSPLGTQLSSRFSGVIAEEEVLQDVIPLSEERVTIATDNLLQANLPLDGAIVKATQLTNDGKVDEAMRIIDETIVKSRDDFPQIHGYALLQKATLLHQQHRSNITVISELETFLSSNPEVDSSFDHMFSGKVREMLEFLKVT